MKDEEGGWGGSLSWIKLRKNSQKSQTIDEALVATVSRLKLSSNFYRKQKKFKKSKFNQNAIYVVSFF